MSESGPSSGTHCPHCKARQFLLSWKLPQGDRWTCGKCGRQFALKAQTIALVWGGVFWIWSFGLLFPSWVFDALKWPGVLNKLAGVLIMAPLLSGVTATAFGLLGWWIGRQVSDRMTFNGESSDLRKELAPEDIPDLDRAEYEIDDGPSRSYVHKECGNSTVVSGIDFERLANPFTFVVNTYCASCDRDVSLSSVRWSDGKQSISTCRRRLRAKAPANVRFAGTLGVPAGGLTAGSLIGWILSGDIYWIVAGAVLGLFIATAFLTPLVTRQMGFDYRDAK